VTIDRKCRSVDRVRALTAHRFVCRFARVSRANDTLEDRCGRGGIYLSNTSPTCRLYLRVKLLVNTDSRLRWIYSQFDPTR